MKESNKNAVILLLAVTCTVALADPGVQAWDPNWNYKNGGKDWDFANCNNSKQQQSPVSLFAQGFDWWDVDKGLQFVFLPSYKAAVPTSKKVENFTSVVYGDFGSVFATEPSNYQVT